MGRKLTIYMLDGSATGPKTIEIGNWSGKAVYSPRAALKKMVDRDEFDSPGYSATINLAGPATIILAG